MITYMTDKKLENIEIEKMNLNQLTQVAIDEATSYGHYVEHQNKGSGEFTVTYDGTGTTSILHQKLSSIGFYEDAERTEINFDEGTKTVFFEYNPNQESR